MSQKKLKKEIIYRLIRAKTPTAETLKRIKRETAKEFDRSLASNIDLLKTYHRLTKEQKLEKSSIVERLLITRPIRSLSGIVNVSVLTKPYPCPGQCIFCPVEKGFPKSYVAGEPAADRAKALSFDPYLQVSKRLEALKDQGHPTDKIELRIVGGTWSSYPKKYQIEFIKHCFLAANDFPKKRRRARVKALKQIQKQNETAKSRIVGLSIETRPDLISESEIKCFREFGITLVEMGIQTVYNEMHEKCKTNLTIEKISRATQLLKDAGFKVLYQVMPGLPGSTPQKDIEMFKILFNDQRFKPDWLKIYPCVVCRNSELYQIWKKGEFKPYNREKLIKLLVEIRKTFPRWVRIARIFRDIPSEKIIAGCRLSNIREVVEENAEEKCKCVRCREVKNKYNPDERVILFRQDYPSSKGKEIFLSFENKNRTKLFSLLRLRILFNPFVNVLKNSAIIRELQTFGPQIPISIQQAGAQHKGMGKKLIKEAEKIVKKEFKFKKIAIISGIGARQYYRKLNYRLNNTYMIKKI